MKEGDNVPRTEENSIKRVYKNIQSLVPIDDFYRSTAKHYGGAFDDKRLFGGQAVAQMYLAARKLKPNFTVSRIDVKFLRPGSTVDPIDYRPVDFADDTAHLTLVAKQNGKVLNKSHVRLINKAYAAFDLVQPTKPIDTSTLPNPLSCPIGPPMVAPLYIDRWLDKHGYQAVYGNNSEHRTSLFEIRPIQLYDFRPVDKRQKPTLLWIRLSDMVRDEAIVEPIFAPLIFSDFLVALPVDVIFDLKPEGKAPNLASMDHKITFHKYEDLDPRDFFFVMQQMEIAADRNLIVHSRIHTRDGIPVISILQQSVYQNILPLLPKL
ncbi:unnamed protein product [Bursaphelenchus okinawaensis]|uniref:Acyl-CoA thioesterase-like C-terminal domain-containing protein n=1 Tax=Bursaphelenchus okinawaensis TaxID=465554 RepID=A0A811LHL7_9BILA|nr:unnamed protein product [Bursaphelenchus okinawaensis]CAG9123982.1 unnamed protein product [Bursaphelenchus okinawaensis]